MRILDEIKNDAIGVAIIKDWWGDDMRHVTQAEADHRSLACLRGNNGEACPNNKAPNWVEEHIKEPIAQAIKRQLEMKFRLKMETPFDDQLHMCSMCGCPLKAKIWTGMNHILKNTPASKIKTAPAYCWMRTEMEAA